MLKVIRILLLGAGAGYAAWRYWQTVNRANAEAWAAGTDRID